MAKPNRKADTAVPKVKNAAGSPAQAGLPLISAPTIVLTVAATRKPADPRLIAVNRVRVIFRAMRGRSINN
jgi:hypothetical protein